MEGSCYSGRGGSGYSNGALVVVVPEKSRVRIHGYFDAIDIDVVAQETQGMNSLRIREMQFDMKYSLRMKLYEVFSENS
ncbi:hypothetical protein L1887_47022 [Cichorium endivia]|nr:hypothetical protein L1887_47022 [Cichorium endivia]